MTRLFRLLQVVVSVLVVGSKFFTHGGDNLGRTSLDIEDESFSYKGYKVFEVRPETRSDVDFLENLMLTETEMDFWTEPGRVGDAVTFMIPGHFVPKIRKKLSAANIKYKEVIQNVEQVLEPMMSQLQQQKRESPDAVFDFNQFNTFKAISDYLHKLVEKCPTDIVCKFYSIGTSYEGRDILVFKISKPGVNRKGFWIDATIHAREWLSTTTAMKMINHLVKRPDKRSRGLVESYDWYIAPVLNPDGYVYTFTKERFWRKNRRPTSNKSCVGIDLNRNFDFRWGTEGISHTPCSQTYCGDSRASELEVQAIQNEALKIGSDLIGWITLHSYGRMWLFPYGGSSNHNGSKPCQRTKDHAELEKVASVTVDAIEDTYHTHWQLGTSCEVIYPNSGSSMDYVKDVAGVKYSYALELRGDNFVISTDQILPSFVEFWNGIVAMCDQIAKDKVSFSAPNKSADRDKKALLVSLMLQLLGFR